MYSGPQAFFDRRCLRAGKRSIAVHHRVPGRSLLDSMISLCLGCHARVHRTQIVLGEMSTLLLALWREQHPEGHEQTHLDFDRRGPAAVPVPLLGEPDTGMLKG